MAVELPTPIVTARYGLPESWTLRTYVDNGGYQGLRKAVTTPREELVSQVTSATLLGRGGAGFPAGQKWSMLRKAEPVYLVVNGDESEPATFKDHQLMITDPHQIVEGSLICAYAVGAAQVFIYVRGEFALGLERMTQAVNEAYGHGAVGRDIFGSGFPFGGGIHDAATLKAFIPGGASAPWFGPDQLDMPLDQDEVGKAGSMLGSGSVVVMDDTTCAVRAAWRITRFFHHESCGQCTPCREGAGWLDKVLRRIDSGAGREEDLELLLDVCDNIAPGLSWPPRQTTICVLGPSIPSSIVSAVRMFRDEFLVHIKDGQCPYR